VRCCRFNVQEHENLSSWLARIEGRSSVAATTWDKLLERVAAAVGGVHPITLVGHSVLRIGNGSSCPEPAICGSKDEPMGRPETSHSVLRPNKICLSVLARQLGLHVRYLITPLGSLERYGPC
jgi:hypothetical protein